MAALYRLRYLFDTGSGHCLWSGNEAALEKFDYPVSLKELPLPETIRRRGYFVIAWYDTFTDWDNAPEASEWRQREEAAFNAAAQELLTLLHMKLGPDFQLVDESKTGGCPAR